MIKFNAIFFNGKNSEKTLATVEFENELFVLKSKDDELCAFHLSDVEIVCGVASSPSRLFFPDGSSCETSEYKEIDKLMSEIKRGKASRIVRLLEVKWSWALSSLLLVIVILLFMFYFIVPVIVKNLASSIPISVIETISDETLGILDERVMSPSRLSNKKMNHVEALLKRISSKLPQKYKYRVVFRDGNAMGGNALALPDGRIVVTDQLVEIADNDDEIAAVLAHELGHVVDMHGVRTVMQNSAASAMVMAVTGDVSSLTAGIPAFLMQMKYSRDFETEADSFAINQLLEYNISVKHFADILTKLSRQSGKSDGGMPSYISTHPDTEDRVRMIKAEAAKQNNE